MKQPVEPHRYVQERNHEIGNCLMCGSDLEADGNHLDSDGNRIPIDDPFNVLESQTEQLEFETSGSTQIRGQQDP